MMVLLLGVDCFGQPLDERRTHAIHQVYCFLKMT